MIPEVLAVIAGVLMALSMPGFFVEFLAIVALVLLFRALDRVEIIRGGFVGMIFYFTALVFSHGWLLGTLMSNFSIFLHYPAYWGFFTFLLFALYESLFFFAFGSLYVIFRDRMRAKWHSFVFVPALYAMVELLRSMGDLGFTGASLVDPFFKNPLILYLLSLVGSHGVVFLLTLLAQVLKGLDIRASTFAIGVAYMILYLVSTFWTPPLHLQGQLLTLYQTNDDPIERYSKGLDETISITKKIGAKGLLIVPEAFISALPVKKSDLKEIPEGGIYGVVYEDGGKVYNSAVYRKGDKVEIYKKVRLFPFAEKLPYPKFFSFLKFLKKIHYYAPGRGYDPLEVEGHQVGVLICFESYFEEGALIYREKAADFIVILTNDGWFKSPAALWQHFAKAAIRAAESGLWVVQVGNKGITGVVDGFGRIRTYLPIGEKHDVHVFVGKGHPTLYSRYWRAMPFILIGFLVLSIAFSKRKRSLRVWK